MRIPGFRPFRRLLGLNTAQRMIKEHSAWLTEALAGKRREPHIPIRKVSEGGFARLMSTPGGRYRAERWWDRVLEQEDR
jgi:hypothetical protein